MTIIRFRYQPTFKDFLALQSHIVMRQFRLLIVVGLVSLILYLLLPLAYRLTDHAGSVSDTCHHALKP